MFVSKRLPGIALAAIFLWFYGLCGGAAACAADVSGQAEPVVIINELHVDPDVATERVEFVELHNPGSAALDLSGWRFTEGILYTFPAGAAISANGYIIVAQDPNEIHLKWSSGRFGIRASFVFGPYAGKLGNDGDRVVLCDARGQVVDEVEYKLGFPWPTVGDPGSLAEAGTGESMQLISPLADNDLGGSWRSAAPTPAAVNKGVYAANLPPVVRQVEHTPKEPRSGEPVTITAKITDADGIRDVLLMYQVVNPGAYIAYTDSQYGSNWLRATMHDDGLDGDAVAGDDIFSLRFAGLVQTHRRLVRYKIFVTDNLGGSVIVPYNDDPQPNFAYFVYDGVPAWRGAVQPGVTPVIEFPAGVMGGVPVYHLISKKSDVENATWLTKGGDEFLWYGTLVYDGEVYDHIRYRMRGGVWRYSMGKNMFKFDFNRGHYFQARDDYGNKYATKWDHLNFSACIQQGSFGQRGEQGMFEALSFKMFNLAGCPASKTNYVHFRIIDEAYEDGERNAAHTPLTTKGTQYDGDFWGLYMTIEQLDGRFLDEHNLPDGNLYKMDGAYADGFDKNNQGPTQPDDNSDIQFFRGMYSSHPNAEWWNRNVNLDAYYAYYVVYQAIHHGDITEKNWFLYHHPETDQWWQLPWDLDLTWTTYYGSNDPSDAFSRAGIFDYAVLDLEKKNRVRALVDLLFNTEQTGQLIDDYAAVINDPDGGLSIVDADRAMWDYHWVMADAACSKYCSNCGSDRAGQGRFYQEAVNRRYERTFEGMVKVMKDYVVERVAYMNTKSADAAIPNTPVVTATGPEGFPANALTFATSAFGDPQGAGTFAAMRWRIAEVAAGAKVPQGSETGATLVPEAAVWKYFKGKSEPSGTQGAWRAAGFDDSQWLVGNTPVGYGESFIATSLADMWGNYSTVYLRHTFDVADLNRLAKLMLDVRYDDGVNIWINGKLAYQSNVASAEMPYNGLASVVREDNNFWIQELGDPKTWLKQGTNVIAIQVLNILLSSSSDCFVDIRLTAERTQTGGASQTVVTPAYQHVPGKYEIEPLWESGDLTTFAADMKIPASVVKSGHTYRVRCRMKDTTGRWSHWSAPVQFVAGEPLAEGIVADLRITELMYNPASRAEDGFVGDEYEYIELKNIGDTTLNLSSVSFTAGVTFDFAGSAVTSLAPGQFALVVRNKGAFLARYGSALSSVIAGEYQGKLSNNGERVVLEDFWNGTVCEFEYADSRGWPVAADGAGHSMVPLDSALLAEPEGSLNYAGNWRASTAMGGSPGADDPAAPQTITINEFSAEDDWVELYNPSGAAVNLSHWYLSDDAAEATKYALPSVTVASHGYAKFEDLQGFKLGGDGDDIVLSYLPGTSADRIAEVVSFRAQESGVTLGRYPDGGAYWFRMTPSLGKANTQPLLSSVMIDEIMYSPIDPNDEYIELYNPTTRAVALTTDNIPWRLDGAVDYNFPAGSSIPSGGRIVVVGFDPAAESARVAAFIAAYGGQLTAGVNLFGPWEGQLSNQSERVGLDKPLISDDPAAEIGWVIVDEVLYSSTTPWPEGVDGTGEALQRIHADETHSGNDPANWQASAPTPGRTP